MFFCWVLLPSSNLLRGILYDGLEKGDHAHQHLTRDCEIEIHLEVLMILYS